MTISSLERIKPRENFVVTIRCVVVGALWLRGEEGELFARDLKKNQATEMRSWPPYTRHTVARGETGRAADANVDANAHLSVVYMYIFVHINTHTYKCAHVCAI